MCRQLNWLRHGPPWHKGAENKSLLQTQQSGGLDEALWPSGETGQTDSQEISATTWADCDWGEFKWVLLDF